MSSFDFVRPPLEITAGEPVSHLIGKFLRNNATHAIVKEKGEFKGIITANSLAYRDIQEPEKTKIKNYIEKIRPILPGTDIKEIIHSFLINNHSAMPIHIEKKEGVFLITQLDLLREIKNEGALKNKKARDIMNFPYCITSKDTLATTKSMLRELHISHLPVVDNQDRIEGLVDAETLLKSVIPKERTRFGEESGERIQAEQILATSLMKKSIVKANPASNLTDIIELMIRNKSTVILIEDKGKIAGIITPKDILKLVGEPVKGVYVTISGIKEEDAFIKSVIDEEVERFVKKISKIYPLNHLIFHVDKYHKTGKRIKYSVRARIFTAKGAFFAQAHSWDITKTVGYILGELEKEIIKKKEKEKPF